MSAPAAPERGRPWPPFPRENQKPPSRFRGGGVWYGGWHLIVDPCVDLDPLILSVLKITHRQGQGRGKLGRVQQDDSQFEAQLQLPWNLGRQETLEAVVPGAVETSCELGPAYADDSRGVSLIHGDCLAVMDALIARHGDEGIFDMIFADPPYFLSNGGFSCSGGRRSQVNKGDWDKSRGPEANHEFNRAWLSRCQQLLKPNGTLWVSGTSHVIFSIGFALQQLRFKLLNDIVWEKPNPPPHLACRYFTHSFESLIWAAKSEKSRHVFNYGAMKAVTGKQMKAVWRDISEDEVIPDFGTGRGLWRCSAPSMEEKRCGRHPTQKPLALLERIILAASQPGDLIFDPFAGSGTTGVAAITHGRRFVGIDASHEYIRLAARRCSAASVVKFCLPEVSVVLEVIDLDRVEKSIDGSAVMSAPSSTPPAVFKETKFIFLACASQGKSEVIHETQTASFPDAWASVPQERKTSATHVVEVQTRIHLLARE